MFQTAQLSSSPAGMSTSPFGHSLEPTWAGTRRLVEIDGDLALELYNYLGPAKTFWELANPGAFYRGMPRC